MNKGKILKITENTVYIGYEDGSLKEIPIESCEFEPRMGDYVEVYGDIAIKVENSNESSTVKNTKSKKTSFLSKINPVLIIAFVVIFLSVSTYFIMNKVTTNTTTISKTSAESKSDSSSSTESSIPRQIPPSLENGNVDMDKTKYKPLASYDKANYDKWVHDELPRYMKIRISGEVGQVADDPGGIIVRLILTERGENNGKIVSILIPTKYISRTIVHGDKVTFYGETNGTGAYQYKQGILTLPVMVAYMYEN